MSELRATAIGGQPHMLSAAAPPMPAVAQNSWKDLDTMTQEGMNWFSADSCSLLLMLGDRPIPSEGSSQGY